MIRQNFECTRNRSLTRAACVLSAVLLLAGCTSNGSPTETDVDTTNTEVKGIASDSEGADMKDKAESVQEETVGKISYDGSHIQATVMSTGCTASENFDVISEVRDSTCFVTLVRNKPDYCRRAPFAMDVSIEWTPASTCETDSVVFTNPVVDIISAGEKPAATRQQQKP